MKLNEVPRTQVTVSDPVMLEKQNANRRYMMSLDSDALLVHYRTEAVLDNPFVLMKARLHGGWENPTCQLRGHFSGHWLSAAAMHYASTGDMEVKARADAMIAEIALCQKANGGEWAATIPEKYLYRIAQGKRVWAPHYTIHKSFMGLIDMYRYAGNKEALGIAKRWARWFLRWTAKFSREQMDNILDHETGGMLEMWAILYGITGGKDYRTLMDRYYRARLFEPLLKDEDVLTNMHANTTIPEVMGAAAAYEVTGEDKWLKIVKAYWKFAVTLRGRYATGGQTCGEVWTPKMELAARLGDKNQEHCTVYNMMRVADFLLRVTGEKEYADYFEQNLYNGIFAQGYWRGNFTHGITSPYPDRGLLTYFLPLRAGARKGWASETEDFFCCHGTLVQANASFDRGIYYTIGNGEGVAVTQFFSSAVSVEAGGAAVNITQTIDTFSLDHFAGSDTGSQEISRVCAANPRNPDTLRVVLSVKAEPGAAFELKIRMPFWAKGEPVVTIDGKKKDAAVKSGWISIKQTWKDNTAAVEFKKAITAWPLPDSPQTIAFLYGPEVLAGLCDGGITLKGDVKKPEAMIEPDNEREWGLWMNTFKTKGQPRNFRMVPLWKVGYDPYTVYFPVEKEKTSK